MTRLVEALRSLGLEEKAELSGRWARIRGERCLVYLVETGRGE